MREQDNGQNNEQNNEQNDEQNNSQQGQQTNLEELVEDLGADTEQLAELEFEEALERLEVIVEDLDEDNVSLDDSLEKFIEGVRLVKFCNRQLDQAEKKIEMVVKDDEQFEDIVPFTDDDEEEEG